MSNTAELIRVVQLPEIEEHLQSIKVAVTQKVNNALSLICTEDTVKSVKAVRADLNKDLKDFEERRKAVKKAIMTPYEQFEAVYKECISDTYKKADIELKAKIDSVENELKKAKRIEVEAYFEECSKSVGVDFVRLSDLNLNITLSASVKSLKRQVKEYFDKVIQDLALIATLEHTTEILVEYRKTLDVSDAVLTVQERHKAIAEQEKRNAEASIIAEKQAETVEKVEKAVRESAAEEISAPEVEEAPPEGNEPVYEATFHVTGTLAQLKALKKFLNDGGYQYE